MTSYESIIILQCVFIIAKQFNLFSLIVFRRYVFNVEKDRLPLAVVTERVTKICNSSKKNEKITTLHLMFLKF